MKKIPTAIAFCVISAAGAAALAQTAGPGYGPGVPQDVDPGFERNQDNGPGPGMRGGRGDPARRIQQRLERMGRYLELNEGQKARIKAIMEEQHAKRITMRQEAHERISAVLSEQQRAKFEDMRGRRGKGRPGSGWGQRGGRHGYGPGAELGTGS